MNYQKFIKVINIVSTLLVIVVLLYSISWYIYSPLTRPRIDDYKNISSYIRSQFEKDSDVIILQPFWAERAREYLGDLNIINPRDVKNEDLSQYKNIYVFSVFGYGENIYEYMNKKFKSLEKKEFGKLSLFKFQNEKIEKVIYNFYQNIKDAKIRIIKGGEIKECKDFSNDRWRCGGPDWQYIGKEILDIDGTGRECLWSHPMTGSIIEINFENIPAGDILKGFSGLTDEAVRYKEGSPVFLSILIDDKEVLYHRNPNSIGAKRFEIDTSAYKGSTHKITFKVSTVLDGVRHFCFYADVRSR